MGFETLGFAGGRADDWESDLVYWGPETVMLGNDKRFSKDGELEKPLAALHMGLIYVNPEGPNGNLDPVSAAADIRQSFYRMAMNDEEIVALVAGGHTLGKVHGAQKADCVGPEPAAAPIEQQDLGWKNRCGKGNAEDTMTSGLEGAWTQTPTAWSILYLSNLFSFEWEKQKSPGGGTVWVPTDKSMHTAVPDAHVEGKRNPPVMLTTDLALKEDPEFRKIAERFWKNPKEFDKAFAKAWFKLTHRDLGPRARYVGSEVPEEVFIWQDPVPAGEVISDSEANQLKAQILESGLTLPELVKAAWASASTYRYSDMRGGANGARVRLAPQINWEANDPNELAKVLETLEKVKTDSGSKISMADLIVLGGTAAIEKAAKDAGHDVKVPFTSGRGDATPEMTDAASFEVLEPKADAFRNFYSDGAYGSPTDMLVEKADLLTLTVPEMTARVGGMRAMGANANGTQLGLLTDKPGQLNNAFFVNLLDMSTRWQKSSESAGVYEGLDRATGELKWTATSVDLVFGSNSELRAVAEVYASEDGEAKFVNDFVSAWIKVMNLGRYHSVGKGGSTVAKR
jgi:catalase-peroxidase